MLVSWDKILMKLYCNSTYDDLVRYAALGLPPSHFSAALLLGDLQLAYQRAHPLLLPLSRRPIGFAVDEFEFDPASNEADTDIVLNMFEMIEQRFPPLLRGSAVAIQKWIAHEGYKGASEEAKALFVIFCPLPLMARVQRLVENSSIGGGKGVV